MITFFALIIAIILQFVGAIVALSLTKQTKYNISWFLISIAFLVMAIQRFIEFIPFVWRSWEKDVAALNTWLGIITSVLITGGVFFIRKIFFREIKKFRGYFFSFHVFYLLLGRIIADDKNPTRLP